MKKFIPVVFILGFIGVVFVWETMVYLGINKSDEFSQEGKVVFDQTPEPSSTTSTSVEYKIEEVTRNLNVPWSIVWTSRQRMLVTERPGRIRAVVAGALQPQPLINFPEIISNDEDGLMGMAVDPSYQSNKYLYVCLTYSADNKSINKVVRLIDDGNSIRTDKTILDNIPAAFFHAGCRVKFGPDGKLYVTTGDATDKNIAQDKNSLGGKILRLNSDGTTPSDNPFPGSFVYSYGHRNPQGIDWHPKTKVLFETEHGPSVFDGPAGGDEVNTIEAGQNYGWPVVSHKAHKDGMVDPSIVFTPAIAPASGVFYSSKNIPQFQNNFFFGGLIGQAIIRVVTSDTSPHKIVSYEKLPNINYGRIREIAMGPDGNLYFSTSNKDGRGKPQEGDDKIYKIVPNTERQ